MEEIIVNLNVVAQIKKGQKVSTRGEYLDIETSYIIPECIRRWRRQDSRNEMILSLNRIINQAIPLSESIPYLQKAMDGIENLKQTYSYCHQTCARLDMILDKVKKIMPEEKDIEMFSEED